MKQEKQRGSALVYILVAIALLALLTTVFMDSSSQQTQTQNASKLVSELNSQIAFIQSAIQECVLTYPAQDSGLTATEQKNAPYPINPNDSYFDDNSATPGSSSDPLVSDIRCPGNPGGADPSHEPIFSGASGKFLPPAPALFEDWQYYNGDDGVFIMTSSDKTDPFINDALVKLKAKYSACEADQFLTGDNMTSDGSLATTGNSPTFTSETSSPFARACPADSHCFVYWIIRTGSGAVVDCP